MKKVNRTTDQIVQDCITQLFNTSSQRVAWVSDGSMSKIVEGVWETLAIGTKGLLVQIIDDHGKLRNISWRMTQEAAKRIHTAFNVMK